MSSYLRKCLTLCDPLDCSLPCSSVHGIFQARVLEWGAISFSTGSEPGSPTLYGRCFTVLAGIQLYSYMEVIHSSLDKHLLCTQLLAIMNNATVNIHKSALHFFSFMHAFCVLRNLCGPGSQRLCPLCFLL